MGREAKGGIPVEQETPSRGTEEKQEIPGQASQGAEVLVEYFYDIFGNKKSIGKVIPPRRYPGEMVGRARFHWHCTLVEFARMCNGGGVILDINGREIDPEIFFGLLESVEHINSAYQDLDKL